MKLPNIYGKSSYLQNLAKRNMISQKKCDECKKYFLVDKLFGHDIMFKRDYSIFANNKPLQTHTNKNPRFVLKPNLKVFVSSDLEVSFPNRYSKQKFQIDTFSKIFHKTPKSISPINKTSYLIKKNVYKSQANTFLTTK
jgi:hypothetical protein